MDKEMTTSLTATLGTLSLSCSCGRSLFLFFFSIYVKDSLGVSVYPSFNQLGWTSMETVALLRVCSCSDG